MDINKLTTEEENILYGIADDFQENGFTDKKCPRCGNELKYEGNNSSYRITCKNQCGVILSIRGI